MTTLQIKRVAVIGAGPSGIAALEALVREGFTDVRCFERRGEVGGTWVYDDVPRDCDVRRDDPTADHSWNAVYPTLITNVPAEIMPFTYAPFPDLPPGSTINPLWRHYTIVISYLQRLAAPFLHLISLDTSVESVRKVGDEWEVRVRRGEEEWTETFDAVVVCSGHYSVPYMPDIKGLKDYAAKWKGRVSHTKEFRTPEAFRGKNVLVIGGNISAFDLCKAILPVAKKPVHVSTRSRHPMFPDALSSAESVIVPHGVVSAFNRDDGSIEFADDTVLRNIDHVIIATGYKWSFPFLGQGATNADLRIRNTYWHTFDRDDPSLTYVGTAANSISFRVFEYQAVAIARVFSGRGKLPSLTEMKAWEDARVEAAGDGSLFHIVGWRGAKAFAGAMRGIAGLEDGVGDDEKVLPRWRDEWEECLEEGIKVRSATLFGDVELRN
ncbi:hypothetical protein YB2330_002594 [Saitoella coloradoensis]